jgi:hypothetical protein
MLGLTVAAATATTLLVNRAYRLRPPTPSLASRIAAARDGLRHDEARRLVAVGVRSLAAVAVLVTGFHVVAVAGQGQHRVAVTAQPAADRLPSRVADTSSHPASPSAVRALLTATNYLPGAIGQAWRGMQTGLLLVEATTAASAQVGHNVH